MIAPILEEMSKEFEGKVVFLKVRTINYHISNFQTYYYIIFKVDVDEAEEIAGKEGIQAMPTFIFYKNGKRLEDFAGADQDRIRSTIAKHT